MRDILFCYVLSAKQLVFDLLLSKSINVHYYYLVHQKKL